MSGLSALRRTLARHLSERSKRAIRSRLSAVKLRLVRTLLSYDGPALVARLRAAGIRDDDTVMVHANFAIDSGFRGTPADLVQALSGLLGGRGNLLMVSIPFRGAAVDYLARTPTFDVARTVSMMGMISETFRRQPGTRRSLHPTHPVLAVGAQAAEFVRGHEACIYPCGAGSPFDLFHRRNGKILLFDVGFGAMTFIHYVEDMFKDRLPFPVYGPQLFDAPVIDAHGDRRTVRTYTFNKTVPRDARRLEAVMRRQGLVHASRVGNSRFLVVSAADVVSSFDAMLSAGDYPYVLPPAPQ